MFDLTCLLEVVVRPAVKAKGSSFPQTKISTFTTSMVVLVAVVVVVVEAQRRQTKVLRCAKRRSEKRYK